MFEYYESDRIIGEYNEEVRRSSNKLKSIISIPLVLSIILVTGILVSINDVDVILITAFLGGTVIIILALVFFLSHNIYSSRLTLTKLFPLIYDKVNQDLSLDLKYQAKVKVDNKFVKAGGLFPASSRVYLYRQVGGKTEEGNDFKIIDCSLITGGGQYQQTHLNGIYLYAKVNSNQTLQVRSNGRPQVKGTKYRKLEEITDLKVYLPETANLSGQDRVVIQKLREVKASLQAKLIYLSINEGIIHLAYTNKPKYRQISFLNKVKLNEVYNAFINELKLIDELVSIFNY